MYLFIYFFFLIQDQFFSMWNKINKSFDLFGFVHHVLNTYKALTKKSFMRIFLSIC